MDQKLDFDQTDNIWRYGDELDCSFEIPDTSSYYLLELEVIIDKDFPYQNLYTNLTTTFPDGSMRKKPYSIQLISSDGYWNGPCRSHTCRIRTTIVEQLSFSIPGQYKMRIGQYSRIEDLPSVHSLRFRLIERGR